MDVGLPENIAPGFKLVANGGDITAIARERLVSLNFTDAAGLESDTLDVVLADNDPENPIQLPPTGAELELFLGYDGQAQRMGLFVVNEINLDDDDGGATVGIRAHAAPFEKSKGGKNTLQSQKTRSWPKATKLGDLVKKVASEHGMEGAVAPSLAAIVLPHVSQSDESDMHLLVRLARKYDAIVKPAGGKLVLAKRGETTSASGQQLPAVTLQRVEVTGASVTLAKRENSGSVVAAWHETAKAKRQEVKVGEGEPVTRLRMQYPDQASARAAAQSEMDKRKRGEAKLRLQLPGRADLAAEAPLTLGTGFRTGIAGEWVITRVEHALDDGGYVCTVEGEKPNSSGQGSTSNA